MKEKIYIGLFIFYLAISLILFIMMGIDKKRAEKNKWRISEATLILTGFFGGGIGGLLGMRIFHHKSRKPYFYVSYILAIILHAALLYLIIFKL